MDRSKDWLRQAERGLEQARWSFKGEFHELACFLSQQAAEKAVKAVCQARKREAWGHAISRLLPIMAGDANVPPGIARAARQLDRHYVPARYPNGFDTGVPADYYGAEWLTSAVSSIGSCRHGR